MTQAWRMWPVIVASAAAVAAVAAAAACEAPQPLGVAADGGDAGAQDAAPDPFAAPATCESGVLWSGQGSTGMSPGEACLGCHAADAGTELVVAGTLFTAGHVPDACTATGAQQAALGAAHVVVEDAAGVRRTLAVWGSGNFMQKQTSPPIAFPITAWVVARGVERHMKAPQMSGDCNACHTAEGASGAPGRVVLP